MQVPLFRLQCGVNSYDWGKKGHSSVVARLAAATPAPGFTIQDGLPYAELWMGTHPSNPSKDLTTGRTLLDLVETNHALLSQPVIAKYGKTLPFLFKVLSINQALSIQAHPNKSLAAHLHARDPQNYPDDNHKPEMAIALTPFEGFCGFRPLAEIAHFLETVPPLRTLVGDDTARQLIHAARQSDDAAHAQDAPLSVTDALTTANKQALRATFTALMSSPQPAVGSATSALLALATAFDAPSTFAGGGVPSTPGADLAELVVRLHSQFGADYGLFVLFFLNLVRLAPGEAIFLRADDIHAYLSGDVVECMATSDNVVRAGLTPKFKDVKTLVDMLTYDQAPIEAQKMTPQEYPYATLNRAAYSTGSSVALYDPPIEEFSVLKTILKGHGAKVTFEPLQGPSIVLCTAGKGKIAVGPTEMDMQPGYVYFAGSTAECVLVSAADGPDDEFVTFKAFCEAEDVA